MANKALTKLLNQLHGATGEQKDFEPLTDEEAQELAGGSDINAGCPNTGCNSGCPVTNSGCSPAPK